MAVAAGKGEGGVEQALGLAGAGPERGFAGQRVPERPGGDVDERVRRQRQDIEVLRVCGGHLRHRVGVGLVPGLPGVRVLGGHRRVAKGQRRDEAGGGFVDGGARPLRAVQRCARQLDLRPCPAQARGQVDGVERLPALVVVRADRVRDAPVRRPQIRVLLERLLEAGHRLFVVEGVRPHQPSVEPHLSRGRRGRHRAVIVTEVVVRVAHGSSVWRADRPPPPLRHDRHDLTALARMRVRGRGRGRSCRASGPRRPAAHCRWR